MGATSRDLCRHAADKAAQAVADVAALVDTDDERLAIMMAAASGLIERTVRAMEGTHLGGIEVDEEGRTLAIIACLAALQGHHPPTSPHQNRVVQVLAKRVLGIVVREVVNPVQEGRHGV